MATPKERIRYTVEQYLELERAADLRHEFLDGYVYAMAGESEAHGIITSNLVIEIGSRLKGSGCRTFDKDTKVHSGEVPKIKHSPQPKNLFSYPDILVVCGERQYLDEYKDVLINPTVIIEVLSPTTGEFDRGEKFIRYRTYLASLQDYLVVAQDKPLIERYSRQENGLWVIAETVRDLADAIHIPSINCAIPLAEIYEGIVFPEPEADDGQS
jgi:Uma2 family endonuclease